MILGNAKKKILIVDDEESLLRLLEVTLTAADYDVIKAVNGIEAIAMVKQNIPDLIIMDWMIPKIDGIKACAFLKADKRFARIPLIIITAGADNSVEALSKEAGANAFINKPLHMPNLLDKIRRLLDGEVL